MKIQKKSDCQYRQLKSTKTGEEFSRSNVISEALFSTDIFLSHEIIRPNSRSSSPHFHTHTDELVYVLSGKLVAVEGESEIVIEEGDSVMFERLSGKHHFLKNESHSDGHILLIRKKLGSPDIVFPESN